jgi:hypothetical protein
MLSFVAAFQTNLSCDTWRFLSGCLIVRCAARCDWRIRLGLVSARCGSYSNFFNTATQRVAVK